MPKSTKISKIRFNRIRQSKSDYVKHFINQRLGTASAAAFSFGLGAILILNLGVASAQPSSTPPGGAVNARFDSVKTQVLSHPNGACGTWGCTPELSINFLNGIFANYGIVTTGLQANELDLRNSISNRGTTNSGNVKIDDGVIMTGNLYLPNNISIGSPGAPADRILKINAFSVDLPSITNSNINASGNDMELALRDNVFVGGNLRVSGNIKTSIGSQIGSYMKRYSSELQTNSVNTINDLDVSCNGAQIVSCGGWISGTGATFQGGQVLYGSNTCRVRALRTSTASTRLYAEAMCFDPTGLQTGDINTTP